MILKNVHTLKYDLHLVNTLEYKNLCGVRTINNVKLAILRTPTNIF